jgi:hypothetical protein
MRYCDRCGNGHECTEEAAALDREVEITRLNTKRDIEVARIQASAAADIAETEAEHAADFAEGKAEGMETVIEASAPEEPGEGEPVVIEAEPEPEPEPEPDMVPPVVETHAADEPKQRGYWDAYR